MKGERSEVFAPATLEEAVQFLTEVDEPVTIMAGATDLMAQLTVGQWKPPGIVLDILGLEDLRHISLVGDEVVIGALSTFEDLLNSDVLHHEASILLEASRAIRSPQIRHRATIGGNVMNASSTADSLPPLVALGASAVLVSNEGPRVVPLYSLCTGSHRTVAKRGEILTKIRFPRVRGSVHDYFRKAKTRASQAQANVSVAGRLELVRAADGPRIKTIRLGIGSVDVAPTRPFETERYLSTRVLSRARIESAVQILASELVPRDDYRGTASYRRLVVGNMLRAYLGPLV